MPGAAAGAGGTAAAEGVAGAGAAGGAATGAGAGGAAEAVAGAGAGQAVSGAVPCPAPLEPAEAISGRERCRALVLPARLCPVLVLPARPFPVRARCPVLPARPFPARVPCPVPVRPSRRGCGPTGRRHTASRRHATAGGSPGDPPGMPPAQPPGGIPTPPGAEAGWTPTSSPLGTPSGAPPGAPAGRSPAHLRQGAPPPEHPRRVAHRPAGLPHRARWARPPELLPAPRWPGHRHAARGRGPCWSSCARWHTPRLDPDIEPPGHTARWGSRWPRSPHPPPSPPPPPPGTAPCRPRASASPRLAPGRFPAR